MLCSTFRPTTGIRARITVTVQSLLKARFRSAVQNEVLFMIGRVQPVTKAALSPSFRDFVRK
jgi:hypothetical protein